MHNVSPDKLPDEERKVSNENKVSCVSIILSFQWWCHFLFTILGFLIFLFTIASWTDLGSRDIFIEDYLTNWKLKPIVDIIATDSMKWPNGYENLIDRKFGTVAGWNCKGIDKQDDKIYVGSWDVNKASDGCESILPMDKTILSKIYSKNIWALRSYHNFVDMERPQIIKDQIKCSEGK